MKVVEKLVTGIAVAVAVSVANAAAVSTDERTPHDYGAGSEEQDDVAGSSAHEGPLVAFASTVEHSGKTEWTTLGGAVRTRSQGRRSWKSVKHCTLARLEHYRPNKSVLARSGRRRGEHKTEAETRRVAFNSNAQSDGCGRARTYYGR